VCSVLAIASSVDLSGQYANGSGSRVIGKVEVILSIILLRYRNNGGHIEACGDSRLG
jgi:hypothetical protein